VIFELEAPIVTSPDAIKAFAEFVARFGEVRLRGLGDRVADAERLIRVLADGRMVGGAALKNPRDSYRQKVATRAAAEIGRSDYPLELGWIAVDGAFRGRGLAKGLVGKAIEASEGRGLFATTRADNTAMLRVLEAAGFSLLGRPYASEERPGGRIVLLVRQAVSGPA
jgi:ribosomal protein S18 acetylase RimI-like enzyme